jgi:hypothetical protein
MRDAGRGEGGSEGVRRKVLNFTATVSLLLCAGTVVLWVRSYWRADDINWIPDAQIFGATSTRGTVTLAWDSPWDAHENKWYWNTSTTPADIKLDRNMAGFGVRLRTIGKIKFRVVKIPYWSSGWGSRLTCRVCKTS